MSNELLVIGGGLAGSEAAWQAAQLGIKVRLFEMRPISNTPAHTTSYLSELVCSNSLGTTMIEKAGGLLKAELRGLGSLILKCAEDAAVPAGTSLAVDRDLFAAAVTESIVGHRNIELIRQEVKIIPEGPCIIASGPLTSQALAGDVGRLSGQEYLYFYDAISPIVDLESVNLEIAYRGSRYDKGKAEEGDYINCPLDRDQYEIFCEALTSAEKITLRQFEEEDPHFFEGCLPVEEIARRDTNALRFGPMRPVGLDDPRTGRRPYAVLQLRQDNLAGTLYNLVGFQTNLRWGEQRRILRMIPGLEKARFMRYGMMHRNTYINAPRMLQPTLQYRRRANLFFAGQIVGAEGYMGNAATGLVAGMNAARMLKDQMPVIFPPQTMLGALCHYVSHADINSFQPMKANFGLLPLPEHKLSKSERYRYYGRRALTRMRRFTRSNQIHYERSTAERDLK